MSTRSLIGIKYNREVKTTYRHHDGYPEIAGREFLDEIKLLKFRLDDVKANFEKMRMVKSDDKPTPQDLERFEGFGDDFALGSKNVHYYNLLRLMQGSIKANLCNRIMIDDFDFGYKPGFCEFAYIWNIDDQTVDFYAGVKGERGEWGDKGIRLVKKYSLKNYLNTEETVKNMVDLTTTN